jgi:23S rRNA (uridine2552-2'-O)-methyltransferase
VFKLEEIDKKHHLLKPNQRVLDLGCRPGSWLQYAAAKTAPNGKLVGIDRTGLDVVVPRARLLVGDVFEISTAELLGDLPAFDIVLSDMAPDTSGVRSLDQARSEGLFERALEIAEATLGPGGAFVGKLFQGPDWNRLLARVRSRFRKAVTAKPAGTRKESIEQYVVGIDYLETT